VFESINTTHTLETFNCGKPPLDAWLRQRALSNHRKGFTSVVVAHRQQSVIGYYGLAPTAVSADLLPRSIRTGQPPDPLPCILLGRLAVDVTAKGQGLGTALLLHALQRTLKAASLIGGRAVLVTAIDEDAAAYWTSRGFHPTRDDALMLFMGMEELEITLAKLSSIE
jgi:predicted N-acetyltransferase YhbS